MCNMPETRLLARLLLRRTRRTSSAIARLLLALVCLAHSAIARRAGLPRAIIGPSREESFAGSDPRSFVLAQRRRRGLRLNLIVPADWPSNKISPIRGRPAADSNEESINLPLESLLQCANASNGCSASLAVFVFKCETCSLGDFKEKPLYI